MLISKRVAQGKDQWLSPAITTGKSQLWEQPERRIRRIRPRRQQAAGASPLHSCTVRLSLMPFCTSALAPICASVDSFLYICTPD